MSFTNKDAYYIIIYSGESTVHHGIFWVVSVFWVVPVARKRFPSKYLPISRNRFGLPDRHFSTQAIGAVIPVFLVFFDRPQSFLLCFHIIVRVAWTHLKRPGRPGRLYENQAIVNLSLLCTVKGYLEHLTSVI